MLGIQSAFIATTGTALDTVERGGKPRHSLRAAIRMPKRTKTDKDYQTHWVTLQISDYNADYVRTIPVGTRVAIMGQYRVSQSEDGAKTFYDVDVRDITAMAKGADAEEPAADLPSW